jgi:predicted ATP-grasp superfamily ATP-dependent carboligase
MMPGHRDLAADPPPLLLVGGSVRFLAESSHRAGWRVHAADRFGDADLLAVAASHRFLETDLERAADPFPHLPQSPCMFTGGAENAPLFLERMAAGRPLAAASPAAVRGVRDPRYLAELASEAGLAYPETHFDPSRLPVDGSFVVKPLASAGGQGIMAWHGSGNLRSPSLWQRRHSGLDHGISLVLEPESAPRLLGVARAPRCRAEAGPSPWAYVGSVTIDTPPWTDRVLDLAARAAARHGLRGAIGVDCLVEDSGRVLVLEINPRPTASMELFERLTGLSIAATHLAAFGIASPAGSGRSAAGDPSACPAPDVASLRASRARHAGKAILYAPVEMNITPVFDQAIRERAAMWSADDHGLPAVADLPREGTRIGGRHPLLTVFAEADSPDEVDGLLESRLQALRALCLSQLFGEAST